MTNHPMTSVERPLSALDAIFGRRSVRAYTSQTLEKSTVRALLDAAVQAPTAMLEQPWVFVVVQNRRLLRRISDRVKAMWTHEAAPKSAGQPGRSSRLHGEFIERLQDPEFDVFYGAGTLIVICARRMDSFVAADCWLAAENHARRNRTGTGNLLRRGRRGSTQLRGHESRSRHTGRCSCRCADHRWCS